MLIVATNFIFANLCWPKYFWGKLRNFEYFLEKLRNFEYFLGKLRNFEYFSRALVYPRIKKAAKKSNHNKSQDNNYNFFNVYNKKIFCFLYL